MSQTKRSEKFNSSVFAKLLLDDRMKAARYLRSTDAKYAHLSRLNLSGMNLEGGFFYGIDLRKADLRNTCLRGAVLSCACLEHAMLSHSKMEHADFSFAYMSKCDLSLTYAEDAIFRRADMTEADLSLAKMSGADLRGVDLSQANLSSAFLNGALMDGCILRGATLGDVNLSGCSGLRLASDYLKRHFERSHDGYIAYQVVDSEIHQNLEPGKILTETVNPERTRMYGCGIHLASMEYIRKSGVKPGTPVKRILIRWEWLPDVVVPYNTEGQIRCGKGRICWRRQRKKPMLPDCLSMSVPTVGTTSTHTPMTAT